MVAKRDPVAADDALERVRAASDIAEVIGQYVSLRKVGRSWKGLCPFHQEKTPSFTVSPERQTYHCFGCGAGGDVFRFVQEAEKVEFPEALRLLAERSGISLPARRGPREGGDPLYEACREAAEFYRRCLQDPTTGRRARDFLSSRGIQPDTEARYGLGYAPAGWDGLSSRLGPRLGEETLVRAGLAIEREGARGIYDRFRDRVMVPLRLASGRAVGFGGRTLGNEEPKYLNSPETPVYRKGRFVFGLEEAREQLREVGEAVLVEGYFDVLALHQAGVPGAVASCGTAWTPEQASLLGRYVSRLCLAFDGDPAGIAASTRALGPLLDAGLEVRVLQLPPNEDPDSFVRRRGRADWMRLMESALEPAAYLCRHAGSDGAAHGAAVAAVIDLARSLGDLARREALIVSADRLLGAGVEALRRAVENQGRGSTPVRARPARQAGPAALEGKAPSTAGPPSFVERSLLGLLVALPTLAKRALAEVQEGWITHPAARAAWQAIAGDPEGGPARWCETDSTAARELLSALANEPATPEDGERALDDHLRFLEVEALTRELENIRRHMGAPGSGESEARERRERIQRLVARRSHLMEEVVVSKGDAE